MKIKAILHSAALALVLSATSAVLPERAEAGAEPMLGEMMIVGFTFCPRGWIAAEGQLLPINQNQALFSLYGTTYGGDGRTTFGLPDLRGRVIIGEGTGPGLANARLGAKAGSQTATLTESTMPSHSHAVNANNLDGDKPGPGGKLLAAAPTGGAGNETIYSTAAPNRVMSSSMIANIGASQPFDITDPKLGLIHCIATQGVFPSRS